MVDVKKLGFKNLEDIEFVPPPPCDCGCGSKDCLVLLIDEDQDVDLYAQETMYEFDCPFCATLVLRNKQELSSMQVFKMFVTGPTGNKQEDDSIAVLSNKNTGFDNAKLLKTFVELTNHCDFHHLLMLEELEDSDNEYRFLYYDKAKSMTN